MLTGAPERTGRGGSSPTSRFFCPVIRNGPDIAGLLWTVALLPRIPSGDPLPCRDPGMREEDARVHDGLQGRLAWSGAPRGVGRADSGQIGHRPPPRSVPALPGCGRERR